jgi:hypothetical protein
MIEVQVRVGGCIDQRWSQWFDDLTITHTDQGDTLLTGSVPDHAALYGLIARLRDLGLRLRSVSASERGQVMVGKPSEGCAQA